MTYALNGKIDHTQMGVYEDLMCLTMRELQALARKHRVSSGKVTKQQLIFRLAIIPGIEEEAQEICRLEHGAQKDLTKQDLETFSTDDLRNYAKMEKIPGRSIAKSRADLIDLVYDYRNEATKRIKRRKALKPSSQQPTAPDSKLSSIDSKSDDDEEESYDPEIKYRDVQSLQALDVLRSNLKRLNGGIGIPLKYEMSRGTYIRTMDGSIYEIVLTENPLYFSLEEREELKNLYRLAVLLTGRKQDDGKNVSESDPEETYQPPAFEDYRDYYDYFITEYNKKPWTYANDDVNGSIYLSNRGD